MAATSVFPCATSTVVQAGTAVIAMFAGSLGGIILNPASAVDQGLAAPASLYVSIVGDATLGESSGTFTLFPGQSYTIPAGLTTNVSVNSGSSGHRFSGIIFQPQEQFPPTPSGDTFPPSGNTSLLDTIKSYLYQQYSDDSDLQAFVASYNSITQSYIDWFAQALLPIYTGPLITGSLLDWVGTGLYGMPRPVLPSGRTQTIGPLNTYGFNSLALNTNGIVGSINYFATDDDVYKRILTWHLYKGDGKVFNIKWLKRRIMRFLFGVNGTDFNIDQTYAVSVTLGPSNTVTITIPAPVPPLGSILQAAIESGVLELPFQFTYVVNVA